MYDVTSGMTWLLLDRMAFREIFGVSCLYSKRLCVCLCLSLQFSLPVIIILYISASVYLGKVNCKRYKYDQNKSH